MTSHILSIRHGAVLDARLNRPEKMNALTGAMYSGIVDILEQASSSNSIRAVLEGEAFARAVRGPEAREAFTAFFEKRKPVFDRPAAS